MMNKGDKVLYVPHEDHAMEPLPDDTFAWEFARKDPRNPKAAPEKLTPAEVREFLKLIRRKPERKELLVKVKPCCTFPATVREVVDEETLNLDIQFPHGQTAHYDNIKKGTGPHQWHESKSETNEE